MEVVFARGTFEPPGIGATGEAFVDSLRFKLDGKSVDVYAVNYPASLDFATERLPADHRQHRAADHRWQSLRRQDHGRLHPLDPICSPSGGDNGAHTLYAVNGMTDRAVDFVARNLTSSAETSR